METKAIPEQISLKWFDIWCLAFIRPTIKTFSQIIADPKAGIKWGIIWMVISTLIIWFAGLQRPLLTAFVTDNFGPQVVFYFLLVGAIVFALFGVIILLIMAAMSHGLARLFAGAGTFHQLVYCWAVISPPFILLSGLVINLPSLFLSSRSFMFSTTGWTLQFISLLVFTGVNLYQFYAEVVAFSAVEKLGILKGFGILILQAIIISIVVACLSFSFQTLTMNLAQLH